MLTPLRSLIATSLLSAVTLMGAEVPRPAAEYALTLPDGKMELLSKHKGKVVMLAFILTTCPHCQNTAKLVSRLNTEYGGKGFQPLMVAINPDGDVRSFVQQYQVNFPVGKGTRESAYAFLQQSIMAPSFYVPQVVFIDRKGVIRAQYGGSDAFMSSNEEANIRGMVEKLVAEGAPATTAKPAAKPAKKKG
jgi:cytochrome oxidase Cu insertion factor (SCO1/SenC/PrrC family)